MLYTGPHHSGSMAQVILEELSKLRQKVDKMVDATVESDEDEEFVVKLASKQELDIFEERLKANDEGLKSKLVIILIKIIINKYLLSIHVALFWL